MEKTSYRLLACWRCRGARMLPDGADYYCPVCDMPVGAEDVTEAWYEVEDGEAKLLTADTWDTFVHAHGLEENGQTELVIEIMARRRSWRDITLRELREYMDQGDEIAWLPPASPQAEDEEDFS